MNDVAFDGVDEFGDDDEEEEEVDNMMPLSQNDFRAPTMNRGRSISSSEDQIIVLAKKR
jgi:hypothetical protein